MDTQLISEVLSWAELASGKRLAAGLSVSDLILALYVMSYFNIKKGGLIVAFLVCELWGYGVLSDWASNELFYIVYAAIYSLLYFYIKTNAKWNIAQLSSLVLIVLLEIGMAIDAHLYPSVKTYFWLSYESNVLLLHAFIIASFINWRLLRSYMGYFLNAFVRVLGINDAARFYWYNIKNKAIKQR